LTLLIAVKANGRSFISRGVKRGRKINSLLISVLKSLKFCKLNA